MQGSFPIHPHDAGEEKVKLLETGVLSLVDAIKKKLEAEIAAKVGSKYNAVNTYVN